MPDHPMTFTWKGKLREDCTREELYDAIEFLGEFWRDRHSDKSVETYALGQIEMMKRYPPAHIAKRAN